MHISKETAMDEYLFITMAKLKADRLRLEREQRQEQGLGSHDGAREGEPVDTHRHSARTRWFSRNPRWREQS
jgi:hypothetical protein